MKDSESDNGHSLWLSTPPRHHPESDNSAPIHETQQEKDYTHGASGFLLWHRDYVG